MFFNLCIYDFSVHVQNVKQLRYKLVTLEKFTDDALKAITAMRTTTNLTYKSNVVLVWLQKVLVFSGMTLSAL